MKDDRYEVPDATRLAFVIARPARRAYPGRCSISTSNADSSAPLTRFDADAS
jgi:hypothetical protein